MGSSTAPLAYAVGIVERYDNHLLILLTDTHANTESQRLWQFPRGPIAPEETPEVAMRRIAVDLLGLEVEIIVGQPPVPCWLDGKEVELRFFFCSPVEGEAHTDDPVELRWVPKAHLREYDFDVASQPVADWILEN